MLIHRVTGITVSSLPLVFVKTWLIVARGETASLGWTNPRLVPDKPRDGLLTFSFEADEPTDIGLPVLAPTVSSILIQPPEGVRGVRVTAQTNEIVRVAPIYRASGSGDEEEGDHDFVPYESEAGDSGYEPEDAGLIARSYEPEVRIGSQCDRTRLFKVISRIEVKVSGFKLYRRERYLTTFLRYCYPTDIGDDAIRAIRNCLPVAIAAGVAGASGGPGAAAAAFIAALKGCVGAELASQVSVSIVADEEVGQWHRV